METQINNAGDTVQLSAIERALAAAKARKAARDAHYTAIAEADPTMSKAKQIKMMKAEILDNLNDVDPREKAKPTDEAREAARAKIEADRAARKAEREAAKAAKAAARKTAPHTSKVERALSKLPTMSEDAKVLLNAVMAKCLSSVDMEALAQHLSVHARAERTASSIATDYESYVVGAAVEVIGGEAKYIGMTGTLVVVNRLRVQVKVPWQERPLYLYRADVKLVPAAAAEEAAQLDSPGVG